MIARIWHGWTERGNADAYERLLREEIFPGIEAKGVSGLVRMDLLRRPVSDAETEFTTILWFEEWDDVRAFAGDDVGRAYVPEAARRILVRFDERSSHHEVRIGGAAREDGPPGPPRS